jgi:hypothetical protein
LEFESKRAGTELNPAMESKAVAQQRDSLVDIICFDTYLDQDAWPLPDLSSWRSVIGGLGDFCSILPPHRPCAPEKLPLASL